jgi:hypothetical protein
MRQIAGGGLRQAAHGKLTRAIDRQFRITNMARLGASVDNFAAVALFFKRFYRGLDAPDNTFNVDIVDFIDDILADLFNRREAQPRRC